MIENNSGFRPAGHGVLLRAFELDAMRSKIAIPDEVMLSSATCDTQGIVIAIGEDCWGGSFGWFSRWLRYVLGGVVDMPRAKIGDKVLITRFSGGMLPIGKDGYAYRMIPDHAVYAVKDD